MTELKELVKLKGKI